MAIGADTIETSVLLVCSGQSWFILYRPTTQAGVQQCILVLRQTSDISSVISSQDNKVDRPKTSPVDRSGVVQAYHYR